MVLRKLESLARVAQRARAQASGSANHPEAPTSADFVLPPITYPNWIADETFYEAPKQFYAIIDGQCLPLVFMGIFVLVIPLEYI